MTERIIACFIFSVLASATAHADVADDLRAAFQADERRDYVTEFRLLRPLAEQGSPSAQMLLGDMYVNGDSVSEDDAQAAQWVRRSAEQGYAPAETMLGAMYNEGKGVPQDRAEAVRWWRKAAEQGDADSQYNLSRMYYHGWGVPQDYSQAMSWLSKAADKGNAEAQALLGVMYNEGEGVPQDYAESIRWLLRAANQGNVRAQIMVGDAYGLGDLGVPRDYVQSYMWFDLAAAAGDTDAAKLRNVWQGVMTPDQIADAQQLADAWKPVKEEVPDPQEYFPELGRQASPSHEPASEQPSTSFGTAFFVSKDGKALTNAHVVNGCASITVRDMNAIYPASVVATDEQNDLALLQVSAHPQSVADFRSTNPQLAETVMLFGFPLPGLLASSGNVTTGNVTALAGLGDDASTFQLSAPVQPGNSGGPVLDAAGNVIGVVVAKLNAEKVASVTNDIPQNVNFAIKGSVAQNFLDANSISYSTEPTAVPVPMTAIAKAAGGYTVLAVCKPQ